MKLITDKKSIKKLVQSITQENLHKDGLIAQFYNKEYLIHDYVHNKFHKELFLGRFKNIDQELSAEKNTKSLEIGQLVTYTNEYGVAFLNHEILGFDNDASYGNYVYLDLNCYWCAVPVESITHQEGYMGLTQEDIDGISPEFEKNRIPFDLKILRQKNEAEFAA
ncbi:hypothetical protein AMD27_17400 (plasmid) [Acinetobacter sp. TGL-Y2]|uniref:hypothetical protein n=1 Tax=Acinetobacter sp. TGL-Y2 TaxID=1407071 RepID=UPI0007A65AED|nr:hypothetical protein [Acinetobacter sp. TGL-Y2]AMW80692.1 hypothetical protein AMD27_17400 [Acinetobacter sp. TGL-Y2]